MMKVLKMMEVFKKYSAIRATPETSKREICVLIERDTFIIEGVFQK